MAVLLPSSIPSLFCSRAHMAGIIRRSILKLFLVSVWHQLQGSRVTRAKAGCLVALPALPSLAAPQSGTKCGGSLIHQISQLLPKRACLHLSLSEGGKKKPQRRKRKEKERIKVLIVKHLLVPGGNESRVISEIIDGNVTEVHFPAAH